jgi:hypothetical protein
MLQAAMRSLASFTMATAVLKTIEKPKKIRKSTPKKRRKQNISKYFKMFQNFGIISKNSKKLPSLKNILKKLGGTTR